MDKAGLSPAAQGAFKQNYEQLVAGVTGLVCAPRWRWHRPSRALSPVSAWHEADPAV